jgi:hypothetical protein
MFVRTVMINYLRFAAPNAISLSRSRGDYRLLAFRERERERVFGRPCGPGKTGSQASVLAQQAQ